MRASAGWRKAHVALIELGRYVAAMRLGKMAFAAFVFWRRFGLRNLNWKAWPRLAVYPGIGIAFNRIQKNANTMTVYLLREIETGEVETEV